MASHFLLSAKARTLSLVQVARLSPTAPIISARTNCPSGTNEPARERGVDGVSAPVPPSPDGPPRAEQRRRLIGIALMLGAVACFACLDASAKWVNRTTDPLQTAAVRYLGSFLLVGLFFNPWSRAGILRSRSLKLDSSKNLAL